MKHLILLLGLILGCLLAGCEQAPESEVEIELNAFVTQNYPTCSQAVVCGNLAYVDCGIAFDGPSYYLNRKTGTRISTCGGACMGPDSTSAQGVACRTLCPPKEWTCRP